MITNKPTNPLTPAPVSPLLQRATPSGLGSASGSGINLDNDGFETAPAGALGTQKRAQSLQLQAAAFSGVSLANYHTIRAIQNNSPGAS